jgi:hypothetical protein
MSPSFRLESQKRDLRLKTKVLLGILLVACLLTTLAMLPVQVSADQLLKTDFKKESFDKVVDYFDYARALALLNGLPKPQNIWHSYVYMAYVNKTGLQMLYSGLCNISLADQAYLTIPMQTVLLHYKTENNSRDAIVASSFLMLMGFNDTANSIYENSPDRNDTLWASFSFGLNLKQVFPNADFPAFNSKSEIFPLTSSEDKLTWKWGMRYTNLTALWVTTRLTSESETDTSHPWGLATYEELTFNYTLTIDPDTHTATIRQDYVIGRMLNLWVFWGWFIVPLYSHYNSTGCYMYGAKTSDENIYEFLHRNNVKMSIVNFQTSIMLDRNTYSKSASGQNVTNNDVFVGNSSVSTYADDGEKIFDASFGTKETYNLFNYTDDPTESTPQAYKAITRTTQIDGYARNKNLFALHGTFAMYLPLILVYMYPQMYQRAKETVANMTRADYLYLISYPNYSGYRIEHDPVLTAYFAPATATALPPSLGGLIVLAFIAAIIIAVAVVIVRRRSSKQPPQARTEQPSQQPPPTL